MNNARKSFKDKEFLTIKEASQYTDIEPQTLRKLGDNKTLQCYKTISGQRKFHKNSLEAMCFPNLNEPLRAPDKQNFIYSRVSSKKQLGDLSRQIEFIKGNRPEYASYISLSDVASGINFKRKGLQTILDSCFQRTIGELVIAHRDRLCRFGFELLEQIIKKAGGKVTIIQNEKHTSSEQELAEDLLSIVHIYSCRQMGKRSYKNRSKADNCENEDKTNIKTAEDSR